MKYAKSVPFTVVLWFRVKSHLSQELLSYLNLPKPTFLQVLIINLNMGFIGSLQESRFWWVKVFVYLEP